MANIVVIGAQWGDEGKGKIVDLLTEKFDIVARYQGGHNAGHTVIEGKEVCPAFDPLRNLAQRQSLPHWFRCGVGSQSFPKRSEDVGG